MEQKHKRRPHYSGKYPRRFEEKYKEQNPEKYGDTIEHVISKGSTPAGMHIPIMVDEILGFLEIKPGEKLGLAGRSGSGKTSLINLLLRNLSPNGGSITIAGQNIEHLSDESLKQCISIVSQDTTLFNRSVIENIRYSKPDATMDEIIEASKKANAHDFITELENGYYTKVGERGGLLSGGQRQRILIARAILKNSPILILDEATSALDAENEKIINDSLENLMEGKTMIAIAHKLNTLRQNTVANSNRRHDC